MLVAPSLLHHRDHSSCPRVPTEAREGPWKRFQKEFVRLNDQPRRFYVTSVTFVWPASSVDDDISHSNQIPNKASSVVVRPRTDPE
jgi:hypothetical protein